MGAQTDDIGALRPQIEAVIRDSHALSQALARARNARRILLLVVVVFVCVISLLFIRLFNHLKSPENLQELAATLQKRMTNKNDQYMRQVQMLVDKSSPVLTEAFYSQAKKDLPSFLQRMEKERDDLRANLEKQLSDKLSDHYAQLLSSHDALLKQEFPILEKQELHERAAANLNLALQDLIRKHYIDELNGEILALFKRWDDFPTAPAPQRGEPALEDQFVGRALELLTYRLATPDSLARR